MEVLDIESIKIIWGNDSNWNDDVLATFKFNSSVDLTGFSAKLEIGSLLQRYNITDNKINLIFSRNETIILHRGHYTGILSVLDTQNRLRTFWGIPFEVVSI